MTHSRDFYRNMLKVFKKLNNLGVIHKLRHKKIIKSPSKDGFQYPCLIKFYGDQKQQPLKVYVLNLSVNKFKSPHAS